MNNNYYLGYQLAADFGASIEIGDWHWTPGMADQYGRRLVDLDALLAPALPPILRGETIHGLGWVPVRALDSAGAYTASALESEDYPDPVPDLSDEMTLGAAKAMGELL